MIFKKTIPIAAGIIATGFISSCDFNEDFCIRPGELIAYCDFSNIKEEPPLPYLRHVIPFQGNLSVNEGTTFTQDTLRWKIPQGDYQFFFYTGDYKLENKEDYYECKLTALTDTIEGLAYIAEKQKYCCSAMFNEKLEYQNPKKVKVLPWSFVQKVNIHLQLEGNTSPISSITAELSGVSTSRYLYSREASGSAIVKEPFAKSDNNWQNCSNSIYVFGFSQADANILKVNVIMNEENQAFNEVQEIDLSSELKSFTSDEITLYLTLHVGKDLTLNKVTIDEWEDTPETEL